MNLVVGLGNPGGSYTHSRHNVGFDCVDYMARKWGVRMAERRAKAVLGQGMLGERSLVVAKLRTFMNHSGEGVRYLLARFGASPAGLIIVYDEMDLPLGRIRVRAGGNAAGHRGLESIIVTVGTREFSRVRLGIGRPPKGTDGVEYVLGSFSQDDRRLVNEAIPRVADAVECLIREGADSAMNRFNSDQHPQQRTESTE